MQHSERFLALVNDAKTRIREITVGAVANDIADGTEFALIDTREESEWNAAHAAGARHVSKGIIERDIEAAIPDVDAKIVLYCGGGYRSALAADALQQMGYRNVYSLAGGWRAWKAAGLLVEQD
ncbi:MAG: rhodanese-like domain-containing protein [Bryobacterales bacterium]|nr:rhodanese-like domain-containing protein [Bryobacterales bacterium]